MGRIHDGRGRDCDVNTTASRRPNGEGTQFKEVTDRVYTFLEFLLTRSKDERQDFLDQMAFLARGEVRTWDKPGSIIGMWPCETDGSKYDPRFTPTQGLYLAFIHRYTVQHGRPPAETYLQAYFRTSAPAVHDDVLMLESRGLIQRTPGQARSIKVLLPPEELPELPASCRLRLRSGSTSTESTRRHPHRDAGR